METALRGAWEIVSDLSQQVSLDALSKVEPPTDVVKGIFRHIQNEAERSGC